MAKLLTPEQAARAISFDFEGCVKEAPSLLGWSFVQDDGTERFCQQIVEGALESAARTVPHTAGAVRCGRSTFHEAVTRLVAIAEGQDRLLVSWAHYDLDVIEQHVADHELFERARLRFRNALPTAKRRLKSVHPDLELKRTWAARRGASLKRRAEMSSGRPSTKRSCAAWKRPLRKRSGHCLVLCLDFARKSK